MYIWINFILLRIKLWHKISILPVLQWRRGTLNQLWNDHKDVVTLNIHCAICAIHKLNFSSWLMIYKLYIHIYIFKAIATSFVHKIWYLRNDKLLTGKFWQVLHFAPPQSLLLEISVIFPVRERDLSLTFNKSFFPQRILYIQIFLEHFVRPAMYFP